VTRPAVEARRATVDDLDDLVALWSQAREELGRGSRLVPLDQVRARLSEALSTGDLIVAIGRHEGAAAGYAVLRLAPVLLVDGDTLHIEHLFVLPSMRRRGVARALLVVATSVADRHGADQIMAGAPPAARDTHRFLARLGFSPLMVRRVVGTSALRRRLAGEGQRRGLDDLLSRRRSLRARSLRAGWGGGRQDDPEPDDDPDAVLPHALPDALTDAVVPDAGPAVASGSSGAASARPTGRIVTVAESAVQRIDLVHLPDSSCPVAASGGPAGRAPSPVPAARPGPPAGRAGSGGND